MEIDTSAPITINDIVYRSNTSGLGNIGATCYINTAIQCLGYCTEFFKFIVAGSRPKVDTPLTNELQEVYIELWIKRNAIAPHKFLRSLQSSLGQYITIHEQNDITEFLMLYLDKLNADMSVELLIDDEDYRKIKKNTMKLYNDKVYSNLVADMEIAWLKTVKREFSPIMDMFYGQVVSQIVCGNCNHIHHNYETYSNLSLSIKKQNDNDEIITLQDCLEYHFKDEMINSNDNNDWKCDQCNTKSPSTKSIKLWKNPNILIISLKRFNHQLVKKNICVAAPIELSLAQYTLHSPKVNYNLVAVGNHQGSFGSGHYNCICRHKNNKWYAIDDVMVREANGDEINYVLNNGYVYFYEIRS
jgi:ubiquitin C-terminal hydrolase